MRRYTYILLLFITSSAAFAGGPAKSKFSSYEMNHVNTPTPGLFKGRSSFTIPFWQLKDSQFCYPLPGGKVISAYGTRGGHTGHDIKTKANDTIRSVFDGTVRMSKYYGGYGNVIVIRHENGLESAYSHQSKNFVKPGDEVKAGDPIGLTGRTGRATTEHLHFEFRLNGQHFNPNLILDTKTHSLKKHEIICNKSGKVKVKDNTTHKN